MTFLMFIAFALIGAIVNVKLGIEPSNYELIVFAILAGAEAIRLEVRRKK